MLQFDCLSQVYPGLDWELNEDFESDGWGMEDLENAYQFLIDSTAITGLVIVHKGKMIVDYGNISENSYIASCRKSVTAMLYGPHVASGNIKLDQSLANLNIDDFGVLSRTEKEATIEDVISARSGIFHKGSNKGDFLKYAPERGSVKHGSYWLYSNWDFNVAQYILEYKSGNSIFQEMEKTLAIPLQMQDWNMNLQRSGGDTTLSKFPAKHMVFSTRDMARIGLLMLNKGMWKDREVLNSNWVEEMLSTKTKHQEVNKNVPIFRNSNFNFGYGYMWWLWKNTNDERLENGYSALGAIGQSITVFPNIDLVIAYKTNPIYGRSTSMFKGLTLMKMLAKSLTMQKHKSQN